jgi:hypothetical protein
MLLNSRLWVNNMGEMGSGNLIKENVGATCLSQLRLKLLDIFDGVCDIVSTVDQADRTIDLLGCRNQFLRNMERSAIPSRETRGNKAFD